MIAALPMYDWPDLQPWNDRLWRLIAARVRARGFDVPEMLTRGPDLRELWLRDDLLFGQTCGLPLNTSLAGRVRYLATPGYRAQGCVAGHYASAIVVSDVSPVRSLNELRGARMTINGPDSWSGWVTLQRHAASKGLTLPEPHLVSGGHLPSMQAVAEGRADYAAIDAISLALVRRHLPELAARLRVIDWTARAPATPFITSLSTPEPVVQALRHALHDLTSAPEARPVREALLLWRVDVLPSGAYQRMEPLAA